MDLAYLTGQRPADVLSMRGNDCLDGHLQVAQGKTSKKLRIQMHTNGQFNNLGLLVKRLLEQRKVVAYVTLTLSPQKTAET